MTAKLLKQAIKIATDRLISHAEHANYMHWSFVVQNNKLIEWGMNKKGKPKLYFGYHDAAKIHAELDAYIKARGILESGGFELINVRFSRKGDLKISAPCKVCRDWLLAVGCKQIWFTLPGGGWGKCL